MSAPYSIYPSTATPIGHTLALLLGVSTLGWLFMVGMVWDVARIMPIAELGPGMAWFGVGRFADWEPSGIKRFLDVLCITGADPRALLSDPIHTIAMWLAMMVAMMTPVALTDLRSYQLLRKTARPLTTGVWLFGFLCVWALAACVGAFLQLVFFKLGVFSDGLVATTVPMSGTLLLLAGAYQFTTWKRRVLTPCPATNSRSAVAGGWSAGWRSLRCCWALMAVMFVLGVMNIVAAGVLTALMVLERSHKAGNASTLLGGIILSASGILVLLNG